MFQSDFNYQIIGDDTSQKLVFLHGILGQGRNWASIAKKFSKNYQCMVFDQRGHGQSFKPDSGYSLSDYVEDLRRLMIEVGWKAPIHLIGHSMGGRVALCFAIKYPEWVDKLVIVDIGPCSDWQSMALILEKLDFVPVPFLTREEARTFMENSFLKKYPNKMVMEFFYSQLKPISNRYDWIFKKNAIRQTLESARFKDYWGEFKSLKVPTLLIRGEHSSDLTQEDFESVIKNNPLIRGKVIEGAGHWVHAERPLETMTAIDDFFNIAAHDKQ